MLKAEKREQLRSKAIYGHYGLGASHVRTASDVEVRRHIQKSKARKLT